jgi:hypothetical protein
LNNSGTGSLSFNNTNGPYSISVETQTPAMGTSGEPTTDAWNATASCQCAAPQPQPCAPTSRNYLCGYAMSGYNCDNGRHSVKITATGMTAAIATCKSQVPSGYPDFCYAQALDGVTNSDISECTAAPASWRKGNSCCNVKGTLSCPL